MPNNANSEIKILPMTPPPIALYPYTSNKLSVLLNYKEAYPWFFSNFIQTWVSKSGPRGYWNDFLFFGGSRFCPFYKSSTITKNLVQYKWNSVIDFIIDCIDLNYYVYVNINGSYIPEYERRDEEHWRHDIFIFGYDKKNEMFKVADFFKGYKYYYTEVSFKDFQLAYDNYNLTNSEDFFNGIVIETFENMDYKFDINFVSNCLKDYLAARNTTISTDLAELDNNDDIAYGIQIYDTLRIYLERLKMKEHKYVDVRPFHMIYDHKTVMIPRLEYLGKLNYLKNAENFISDYIELRSESLFLRNEVIRYTLKRTNGLLDKAIKRIDLISIKEKKVLNDILDSIK